MGVPREVSFALLHGSGFQRYMVASSIPNAKASSVCTGQTSPSFGGE